MTKLHLEGYQLDPGLEDEIKQLIGESCELSQQNLWSLIDQAWFFYGCNKEVYDRDRYQSFYNDPIWTVNGLYAEQDPLSQRIRRDIVDQVVNCRAQIVLDWGGGIGTLARMLMRRDARLKVDILEPHPAVLALALCSDFRQISYITTPVQSSYDFVLCTDVLEHLHDPLLAIDGIRDALRIGGRALFANCFEPVIQCHLPKTFYLRYGFRWICEAKGLRLMSKNPGSYSETYVKVGRPYPVGLERLIVRFFQIAYPIFNGFSSVRRNLRSSIQPLLRPNS